MKILICDDHKIVRDGLRQILQQLDEVTFVGEASDGDQALKLLMKDVYEVLLLDISLPDKNGLEVLTSVKSKWPATNVLMLSMLPQEQYAIRALKLGASGYLTKDTASEELIIAIRKVSTGEKYISQSLAANIALQLDEDTDRPKHGTLSNREFEVMIKVVNGKSLQEIGDELFISVKTVSTYKRRIMEKMGFKKNTELTRYCMEKQLI